jgi:hypothetical protein
MKETLFTLATAALSLTTASGVLLHDAQIDGLVGMHTNVAVAHVSHDANVGPEQHVHPSSAQSPMSGFAYQAPSYPPQDNHNRMKRHMTQNHEPRGHHAFDNHHLPIID